MNYIFFLGNHPELSASELLMVLERDKIKYDIVSISNGHIELAMEIEIDSELINKLGGVDRIAQVLTTQNKPLEVAEIVTLLPHSDDDNKLVLGVSGFDMPKDYMKGLGIKIKKYMKSEHGRRVKFIDPKRGARLNSAQVIFNKLTEDGNTELNFIRREKNYCVARTVQIQDIQSYELRDTAKPVRDAQIGMLPPKLAQIMVNLVPGKPSRIYDPFCGLGTIVQEGYLLGHSMMGSDSNSNMVEATMTNMNWLTAGPLSDDERVRDILDNTNRPNVFEHNVVNSFPNKVHNTIEAIVTEPYLGPPLSAPLRGKALKQRIRELSSLYLAFLSNAREVFDEEAWVLMVLPAFAAGFKHTSKEEDFTLFPTSFLDEVGSLGYISGQLIPKELAPFFKVTSRGTLIYSRSDALVGREITLWHIKKQEAQQI